MKKFAVATLAVGIVATGLSTGAAFAQEAKSKYNLTSMCRPDSVTGQLRVRNQSTVTQSFTLKKYGTTQVITGTAPAGTDSFVTVPWVKSSDTWVLSIDGWSFTKAIGANAICI